MADNARGIHVSPGVYSRETDLTYAVKSLGITTLGLVGETQRGPAFQPMHISNWREFVSTFGGTNPEKFKGSQYPKYELPYIAKSYLTQSNQLEVVRVLGLSGYNAGPAWVVTAKLTNDGVNTAKDMVVAVLRPRGHYEKYRKFDNATGSCECPDSSYDTLVYEIGEAIKRPINGENGSTCDYPTQYNPSAVTLKAYTPLYSSGNECEGYQFSGETGDFNISATNLGRFKICGIKGVHNLGESYDSTAVTSGDKFEYAVSLNARDKDYILNVLGTNPSDGDAPLYVESLYDVSLEQAINKAKTDPQHATRINSGLTFYQVFYPSEFCGLEPVAGIISIPEDELTRKNISQRFLADYDAAYGNTQITYHIYDENTNQPSTDESGVAKTGTVKVGHIYTVVQYTDSDGKRNYWYREFTDDSLVDGGDASVSNGSQGELTATGSSMSRVCVKNLSDGLYYRLKRLGTNGGSLLSKDYDVAFVSCDLNNYKSAYRYASTPWILSNLMGDYNNIEMKKMFRFHTISDGDNSNNEVKISIENIDPDNASFDVVVRDINDTDEYQVPLEKFSNCTMVPGDRNYIAYKIGSYDGSYEAKSKYVTVECKENDMLERAVPAGFLGYPEIQYDGVPVIELQQSGITNPLLTYNTTYDEDVKNRKQYFGLSSRVGVDVDMFAFKGNTAYINKPEMLTHGFHLDSRLNLDGYSESKPKITVDGEEGYKFDAVSQNTRTNTLTEAPIIGTEEAMEGSIYEYINLRKFTVYFYGGFDGWDEFRDERTNTDDFKESKYMGSYNKNSGEGYSFNLINDPEALGLNQNGITSDWYAYLSGIRQFANPESVDINVFATPGIDYVNNKSLVEEAIEMIEEERADSIYVVTTPDKPSGAGDFVDEMYTPDDAVYNLEDTDIDSNYTCTYYPWVKYLDQDNNQYIYLPATKDAVRNFAQTDNTAYPWFAPAGLERGNVNCVRAHYVTKLADEDTLYEGRINPVKTFATDGVKIWGQKNLQMKESQLNRIAVRRLLLRMRKLIAIACRSLIFEPNDSATKNTFLSTVTPIMDNIKANRGISDYRIEVNDTVESRERRELPAKIYFKPYNALEYVVLDFILTPEGVSFDNI